MVQSGELICRQKVFIMNDNKDLNGATRFVKLILKTQYNIFIVIIISTFALIHKNICILYAK